MVGGSRGLSRSSPRGSIGDSTTFGLAVFGAGYGLSLAILLTGWGIQRRLEAIQGWTPSSLADFLSSWDGYWYLQIAEFGYPTALPVDSAGTVEQNAWAFYPGFPLVVRAVAEVLGTDFVWTGIVINQLFVLVTVVVITDLVRRMNGQIRSGAAVGVLALMPAASAFGMFYSEAMFVALVAVFLNLLQREMYGWALLPALASAMTRGTGAALSVTLLVTLLLKWRQRPGSQRSATSHVVLALSALGAAAALAFWPVVAAAVTGRQDALTATYAAWNVQPSLGLNWFPLLFTNVYQFIALLCVMAAATIIWQRRHALPPPLQVFAVAYLGVLVLAAAPGSSTVRHLLPLLPLVLVLGTSMPSVPAVAMAAVAKMWWVFDLVVTIGAEPPP
jgi:hypothetical protein